MGASDITIQMTSPENKPKRRRVPVLCLVCKKRKVRCDKGRPACGGCKRNGAAHLCEYVEPPWVKDIRHPEATTNSTTSTTLVEELAEYLELKRALDAMLAAQKREIGELKCQLAQLKQASAQPLPSAPTPAAAAASAATPLTPLTVLNKLRPLLAKLRDSFEVLTEHNLLVVPVNYKKYFVDVFSWMNVVKVDPKLTHMWVKLTQYQRLYHLFKTKQQQHRLALNNGGAEPVAAPVARPLGGPMLAQLLLLSRCPVLHDIDGLPPLPLQLPVVKVEPTPPIATTDIETQLHQMRVALRNIWGLMLLVGQNKLSDKQLSFLMDFYFLDLIFQFELRDLLSFYRLEMISVIRVQDGRVTFDCMGLQSMTSAERLRMLMTKGAYVAMITMIVDALTLFLTQYSRQNPNEILLHQFIQLFGADVVNHPKPLTDLSELMDLFVNYYRDSKHLPTLGFIVTVLAWINREITHGIHTHHLDGNYKYKFTRIFTLFFNLLLDEDAAIAVWKDPRMVQFGQLTLGQRTNDELRGHVSHMWAEMVRLVNLVNFRILPLIAGLETLDQLLNKLYIKIEEADDGQCHLNYLSQTNNLAKYAHLSLDLRIHYHIARMFYTINRGITNLSQPRLTMAMVEELVNASYALLDGPEVQSVLRLLRRFEMNVMLQYTLLFLTFLMMLQSEELLNRAWLEVVVPQVVLRSQRLLSYFHTTITAEPEHNIHQYILKATAVCVLRSIEIQFGLLLRMDPNEKAKRADVVHEVMVSRGLEPKVRHTLEVIDEVLTVLECEAPDALDMVTRMRKQWSCVLTAALLTTNYAMIHRNLPEFAQMQRPLSSSSSSGSQLGCPVLVKRLDLAKDLLGSSGSGYRKCPISHITTPVDNSLETPKILGVLEHQLLTAVKESELEVQSANRKRKCPFDHALMGSNSASGQYLYNPLESNIRSGASASPLVPVEHALATPRQPAAVPMPSQVQVPPMPNPFDEGLSPDFADFGFGLDFDTLQLDMFAAAPDFGPSFDEPFEQTI